MNRHSQALRIELDEDRRRIRVLGALDLYHYRQAERELKKACNDADDSAVVDLSEVTRLDTAGAMLLRQALKQKGRQKLEHLSPEHQALFDMVAKNETKPLPPEKKHTSLVQTVINLGKATVAAGASLRELIAFSGRAWVELGKKIIRPFRFRLGSITHHIEETGINAIPIVVVVAFVISVVIAYQGQAQLRPLGAQKYTVNLIAVSVLREMGVLLTSIMVAGRSGSAFTSSIGVMKVREEVDALRTFGFEPFELLVLPRLIALLIALPLLTFIADAVGLFGGGLISLPLLDISMTQYIQQAHDAVTWKDFAVGMIKAPLFAFIIGLVGCMHGFKVSGSSESVGKETTASVVESIFLVLVLDGLLSIFFKKVGL